MIARRFTTLALCIVLLTTFLFSTPVRAETIVDQSRAVFSAAYGAQRRRWTSIAEIDPPRDAELTRALWEHVQHGGVRLVGTVAGPHNAVFRDAALRDAGPGNVDTRDVVYSVVPGTSHLGREGLGLRRQHHNAKVLWAIPQRRDRAEIMHIDVF